MTFIQPRSSEVNYEDGRPWLVAVDRGFNKSVTLDLTNLPALAREGDYVKSGIPIVKSGTGATAVYVVAADAATADGVIFDKVYAPNGVTKVAASMMRHGVIKPAAGSRLASVTLPATILKEG